MLKRTTLAIAGLAALGLAPAFADNTDTKTVTVSGTIVAPLEIGTVTNLTMPHLVKPSATEPNTSVKVECGATDAANTLTYSGNGNPFAGGTAGAATVAATSANAGIAGVNKTGTCATLAVAGESGYFFKVTTGNITAHSTAGVTVSAPECRNADGSAITTNVQLASGAASIKCGATVTATAAAVSYTGAAAAGSFDVTVTYD